MVNCSESVVVDVKWKIIARGIGGNSIKTILHY